MIVINDIGVVGEFSAIVAQYETALADNDVEVMRMLFWESGETVCFDPSGEQHGHGGVHARWINGHWPADVDMGARCSGRMACGCRTHLHEAIAATASTTVMSTVELASNLGHVLWVKLPCAATPPALRVRSGAAEVVFDTNHESNLEDLGRDPLGFLPRYGIPADQLLDDAIALAHSTV